PIGIFGTYWAHRRLKEVSRPERGVPMDWPGFVYFSVSIVTFLLALTFAAYGTFPPGSLVALVVISALTLALFVRREKVVPHPLLDLKLLSIKEFTGGVIAQMLNSLAWGAVILLLSLYLQLVEGFPPLQAGLAIIPFDLAFLAVGPLSGRLSDRYGHMPFTTAGLAVMSASLLLMSSTSASEPYLTLATYLVIFGVGVGLFSSPNMSSIMGSVPPQERGVASGVRATFFNVGFVLSFNVAILVMTMAVPYSVITQVISSTYPASSAVNKVLFARGLDYAFQVSAVINAVAIAPSVMRGKRATTYQEGEVPAGFEPE
ncbi:MAG TPA: MFS transporter, partial [Nitrososphaerales archaeon]|nr:MFS transporter [Nitrososphaerales archaeon]